MNQKIFLMLAVFLTLVDCKKQSRAELNTNAVQPTKSAKLEDKLEGLDFRMYAPDAAPGNQTSTPSNILDQFAKKLPDLFRDQNASSEKFKLLNLPNETVLATDDGLGFYPIASVMGDQFFLWSTLTIEDQTVQPAVMRSTNLSFKHLPDVTSVLESAYIPYILYDWGDKIIHPISAKDHIALPSGTLIKSGNQYLDPRNGKKVFEFVPIAVDAWKLQDNFYSGYACPGSVIWRQAEIYYVIKKEFENIGVSEWQRSNDTLALKKPVSSISVSQIPPSILAATTSCPFNRAKDIDDFAAKLEYSARAEVAKVGSPPQKISYNLNYKTGDRLSFVDSYTKKAVEWVVLQKEPLAVGTRTYFVYNLAPYEGHEAFQVFQLNLYENSNFSINKISDLTGFLLYAMGRIDDLEDTRIEQQKIIGEYTTYARNVLAAADAKANAVGSGFKEWYKPVIQTLANAASDLMLDQSATANKIFKPFGVSAGQSLQGAITGGGVSIKNRIAATMLMTMVEGLTTSSQAVVARLLDGKPYSALESTVKSTGQTGLVYALRCVAAVTPTKLDDPLLNFGSGLVMRYRKISVENQIGYNNKNDELNLFAGGATAAAQILALNAGFGAGGIKAIGKGGVILSEVISGRSYPGVIMGGLVEVGADLAIPKLSIQKHPYLAVVRPFLNTLAAQVNAMIQLNDAQNAAQDAGGKLDQALDTILSEANYINGATYILKNQRLFFDKLGPLEKSLVLTTLSDPHQKIRDYFK